MFSDSFNRMVVQLCSNNAEEKLISVDQGTEGMLRKWEYVGDESYNVQNLLIL